MPLVMLGTGILWFGWFGFNAGSALAANGQAAQAFMNTFLAAAAAGLAWVIVEWIRDGHPTNLGCRVGHRRRSGGDHPGVRVRLDDVMAFVSPTMPRKPAWTCPSMRRLPTTAATSSWA